MLEVEVDPIVATASPAVTDAVVEVLNPTIQYTAEFLLALKDSPLVGKPEGMVLDYVQYLDHPHPLAHHSARSNRPNVSTLNGGGGGGAEEGVEGEGDGFTKVIVKKKVHSDTRRQGPDRKSPMAKQTTMTPRSGNRSSNNEQQQSRDSRRDTGRNSRTEKTPEWMDFDANDAKTDFSLGGGGGGEMDDMEKFREQMKAEGMSLNGGAAGMSPDAVHNMMDEYIPENTREIESGIGSPKQKKAAAVPVDQMFGQERKPAATGSAGGGGQSRFAALFDQGAKEKSSSETRPAAPPGITTIEQNLESATSQIQAMLSINPTQRPPGGNVYHGHQQNARPQPPPPQQNRQYSQPPMGQQQPQQFRPPMASPVYAQQAPQPPSPAQAGPDMQRIMSMLARSPASVATSPNNFPPLGGGGMNYSGASQQSPGLLPKKSAAPSPRSAGPTSPGMFARPMMGGTQPSPSSAGPPPGLKAPPGFAQRPTRPPGL